MSTKAENFFSETAIKDKPSKKLLLSIRENSITADKLADGVVTTDKIADGSISEEKLDNYLQSLLQGKNIKYVSFDNLDSLTDPKSHTGLYYVYKVKTEDYTQVIGVLLVQTDEELHQITQHFFSNYNMTDSSHSDTQTTYYKRHYSIDSSSIDTGKWTDWENAITSDEGLKELIDSVKTDISNDYLKKSLNTGTFSAPIFNNATFSAPIFNGTKGTDLFLASDGFTFAGSITHQSGTKLDATSLTLNDGAKLDNTSLTLQSGTKLDDTGLTIRNFFRATTSDITYDNGTYVNIGNYQAIFGKPNSPLSTTAIYSSTINLYANNQITLEGNFQVYFDSTHTTGIMVTNHYIIIYGDGLASSDTTKQSATTLWNTVGSTTSLTDYADITDNTITINGKSVTVNTQKEVLSFLEMVDNVAINETSVSSWGAIVYDKTRKTFLARVNTGTEDDPIYVCHTEWTTRNDYCAEAKGVPYTEKIYTDGVSTYYFNGTELVCIGRDVPTIDFSNLDTVLGANPKEVLAAIRAVNGKHPLKYIVMSNDGAYDVFVGYIEMFADGLSHCLTQEFTTNYLIDADGKIDGTTHDHKLHKYVRYYNIRWSGTDWRGKEWSQGTWTIWNSPEEDVEDRVTTLEGKMVTMTVDEYDTLTTKDANTYYFLKES